MTSEILIVGIPVSIDISESIMCRQTCDHHLRPPRAAPASTHEMCYQPVENKTPAVWFISPGCIHDDSRADQAEAPPHSANSTYFLLIARCAGMGGVIGKWKEIEQVNIQPIQAHLELMEGENEVISWRGQIVV